MKRKSTAIYKTRCVVLLSLLSRLPALPMEIPLKLHKSLWRDRRFIVSSIAGVAFLGIAAIGDYLANDYIREISRQAVTDLFLDHLPVVDVNGVLTYGLIVFLLYILWLFITQPQSIPFTLNTIALLIVIRSIFIVLTHTGPQLYVSPPDPSNLFLIPFDDGFFFSGHTAIPFILAFVFWDRRPARYIFIAFSILFAVTVLLGHVHYSIDVFAAYFIAYGTYKIAERGFRDYTFKLHKTKSFS